MSVKHSYEVMSVRTGDTVTPPVGIVPVGYALTLHITQVGFREE